MKLNEILSPSIRRITQKDCASHTSYLQVEERFLLCKSETPMWQQRQSSDSDFCKAVVANGYMTEEQMQEAVRRYRLGRSRDGGVIFWQIDTLEQTCDGKIMYYRPDCHRDHDRHPQWVSNLLKRHYLKDDPQLASEIKTHHCLFGTHLVKTHPQPLPVWRGVVTGGRCGSPVAVVEAEKTAVILSAHYPEYLWLAAGGLTELTPQKLFPLRHHRIVLFPDTDLDQTAYTRWYAVAQDAHRQYGLDITVSSLLERRATAEQKQQKIDLVDFLFQNYTKSTQKEP